MKFLKYPEYEEVSIQELKPMTGILEAGSNLATINYEHYLNHYPYKQPFTHAFIHIENGDCINVGLTTKKMRIEKILAKSHYYLAIEIKNLTPTQIEIGKNYAYSRINRKKQYTIYDAWGFICFGVRKLGFKSCKSSEKFDFCSDEYVDNFSAMGEPLFENMCGETTSPSDIYIKVKDYDNAVIKRIKVEL